MYTNSILDQRPIDIQLTQNCKKLSVDHTFLWEFVPSLFSYFCLIYLFYWCCSHNLTFQEVSENI